MPNLEQITRRGFLTIMTIGSVGCRFDKDSSRGRIPLEKSDHVNEYTNMKKEIIPKKITDLPSLYYSIHDWRPEDLSKKVEAHGREVSFNIEDYR